LVIRLLQIAEIRLEKALWVQHFLCLLLDISWNIYTSHITSTSTTFQVILQLIRYVNYLYIYLLTVKWRPGTQAVYFKYQPVVTTLSTTTFSNFIS